MWNLLVFAVIGLLTGAAARLLYPGRRSTHILGTMLIGIIGAVAGGKEKAPTGVGAGGVTDRRSVLQVSIQDRPRQSPLPTSERGFVRSAGFGGAGFGRAVAGLGG